MWEGEKKNKLEEEGGLRRPQHYTQHGSKSDITQRDRPTKLALYRDPFPLG